MKLNKNLRDEGLQSTDKMILEKEQEIYKKTLIIKLLEREILNTMKNPLKEGDVLINWKNKCIAIDKKQKAIRRLSKNILRLNKYVIELKNKRQ